MSKLQSQVVEFHKLFGQAIEPVPTVPSRKIVALRVMLIVEETMEFVEACMGSIPEKMLVEEMIRNVLNVREPRVDLAAAADALGDLDYVVEGSRLAFGIDGESVADAIHAANIEKIGGKLRTDGKQGKPSNWAPPDIEKVLLRQNAGELPSVGDRLRELEKTCPTCAGTGGVSATSPGEEEKGYTKPCPTCRDGAESPAAVRETP